MATITTDTFLDAAARTAGEAWTINNGATLTVRTDTRWHAGSPASMTGTLGDITISSTQGGSLYIDATKVRWMSYNTGTGNVPAIGTTITQGGVSGYLLGVWADYVSAPTAVGAAMPATGYLKFREVTGGQFAVGALTGIGASATEVDRAGWIEVVADATTSSARLVPGVLGKVITAGDFFYLDTTSGSRHQVMSIPVNGGTSTYLPGVQIETAPGSGIYEWYSGELTSHGFTTTRMQTDARAKAVLMNGTGITIGGDGTNSIGYLPPAGCKVRIPNIILRVATTAARSVNLFPDTEQVSAQNNYVFGTSFTLADLKNCIGVWELSGLVGVSTVNIENAAFDNSNCRFSSVVGSLTLKNVYFGAIKGLKYSNISTFLIDGCDNVTIDGLKSRQGHTLTTGPSLNPCTIFRCNNLNINNLTSIFFAGVTDQRNALTIGQNVNTVITGINCVGGSFELQNNKNISVSNYDFIWSIAKNVDTTGTTSVKQGLILAGNDNLIIDGMSVGNNGAIANVQPPLGVILFNSTSGKNVIRNVGARSSMLPAGSNASYYPDYFVRISAGCNDITVQRSYCENVRNNVVQFASPISNSNIKIEHVFSTFSKSLQLQSKNSIFRNIGATPVTSGQLASGTHFIDYFTSDILGVVEWVGISPSSLTAGENFIFATGTSQYVPQTTQVLLNTVGDYFYSEMTYFIKGHISFRNLAPTITGTNTNLVTFEYQIDTGGGWNGIWKTLTAANLITEFISPTGFKMKFRGTQTSAGTAQITSIQVFTDTSVQAQTDNLYPLSVNTLSFTGLVAGSEVRCYEGSDPTTSVEIGGTEATGGSTFSFTHSSGGQDGYIMIIAMGYQPIYLPYTFKSVDESILIQPVIDRNYNNPV